MGAQDEELFGILAEARAAEDAHRDLQQRVDAAQQLADMGDYDWHIPSDTHTWSDGFYRIFGYEPGSRELSYAVYLEHCHPDERASIIELHERSRASGASFTLTHRIVRPDGEVRHLLCNGEMIPDQDGTTIGMRGTSVDITDRVLAEEDRERHAARLHAEQTRRRAALELNDSVVQGLTAALYALELEDAATVRDYVRRTLDSARAIITDLVDPHEGELHAGDLVRSAPSGTDSA